MRDFFSLQKPSLPQLLEFTTHGQTTGRSSGSHGRLGAGLSLLDQNHRAMSCLKQEQRHDDVIPFGLVLMASRMDWIEIPSFAA